MILITFLHLATNSTYARLPWSRMEFARNSLRFDSHVPTWKWSNLERRNPELLQGMFVYCRYVLSNLKSLSYPISFHSNFFRIWWILASNGNVLKRVVYIWRNRGRHCKASTWIYFQLHLMALILDVGRFIDDFENWFLTKMIV